jgi:DNA-binding IclR family transcriptional regulator
MDYVRGNDLLRRGRQEVDHLSRETGETSELCMLQNGRYTIVHASPGTRPFRISSATGLQIPLPWTASGRLLLAGLEKAEIEAMVSDDDLVLPDGRKLKLDDFISDIAKARVTGYCVTSGLVDAYTKCLAVPVFSAPGKVEATMCLVVPIDTTEERTGTLIGLLRDRASRLSIGG